MADDSKFRSPQFQKFSIAERIQQGQPSTAPSVPEEKSWTQSGNVIEVDFEPLPMVGDEYIAHSGTSRSEITLMFILKDGSCEGFSYSDLTRVRLVPGKTPGSGMVVEMRFATLPATDVRLDGMEVKKMLPMIARHRLSWIREHSGVTINREKGETVIQKITIQKYEEPPPVRATTKAQ